MLNLLRVKPAMTNALPRLQGIAGLLNLIQRCNDRTKKIEFLEIHYKEQIFLNINLNLAMYRLIAKIKDV